MGSMSHMRQESPGFSRGEEFKAVVEFLRCFRFDSVSSGMCGLVWIVTALIWLFLIRWDDKPDGLDGSDLEDPSE